MTELTVRTDRSLIRAAARSVRYVVVTVVAPVAAKTAERQPIDVAFVLDRSGSMGGEKIVLARDAVLQGLAMLQPRDRFAVVAYDNMIDLVVPLTQASAEARANAERRLREIDARGSTDLGGGWLKGCQQLAEAPNRAATARCLLMSDGQANQGITDPNELERHARELRDHGLVTSTFGVGGDFDERLMSAMARAGGGHGYFIQRARQVGDLLTSELGESLEVALENGDYGAIIDLMQSREQTCPGGQPQGAGGPFPLCEGAAQGEVRTGYDLARRYSEGSFVDRDGVILYVEGFMNAVTPTATDAHGDGALRLQGVSCAQESGGNCELATVFFTAILEESRRELLIFWVPLPASPEKPINMIWNGAILPDDEPVVFESGGDLFDLGEVYVLEE